MRSHPELVEGRADTAGQSARFLLSLWTPHLFIFQRINPKTAKIIQTIHAEIHFPFEIYFFFLLLGEIKLLVMKTPIIIIFIALSLLTFVICNTTDKGKEKSTPNTEIDNKNAEIEVSDSASYKSTFKRGNSSLLDEIKLNEPSAKEAIITPAGILYIAVLDNGTSRDGLAEYYCQLASDYHSTVRKVKIVRYGSTRDPNRDNAYGVLLGESQCR